jgi:hypothetical protein
MKIYKPILYSIVIVIATGLFYLYQNNRIIVLWQKEDELKKNYSYLPNIDSYGIWIDSRTGKEKKITCSIDKDAYQNVTEKEDLLYLYLYKYFYYINIENIGKFQYNLNHLVINDKIAIINGKLFCNKDFSAEEEYLFLKSIFLTIKILSPHIQEIYFYNDSSLLEMKYIIPFFNEDMLIKEYKENNNTNITGYSYLLVPFIQGIGNKLFSIYEKNIFQGYSNSRIFLPKAKNRDAFPQEINTYKINDPNKIILYLSFVPSTENKVMIYYYPFINKDNPLFELSDFPQILKNNPLYTQTLHTIYTGFSNCHCMIAPLNLFFDTAYPSFYIIFYVANEKQIKENLRILDSLL